MLRILTLDERDEWEKLVQSFNKHDIYYMPGYMEPFALRGHGKPFLFYYSDENGKAINVFHLRDTANIPVFTGTLNPGCWFDIITPYGYGGMLAEPVGSMEVLLDRVYKAFDKWAVENNIVTEFVRFHPMLDNYSYNKRWYEHYLCRITAYMDLSAGEEGVWSGITSKNRNMVRKAEKCGIRIIEGSLSDLIEEFKDIYNHTMERNNASEYYLFNKEFYDSTVQNLDGNGRIFAAEYEGRIVSASIILFQNKNMHYHLSGTYSDAMAMAPNNLLLWEAARWGCRNGFTTFHLGGGTSDSPDDSLFRFKSSFSKSGRAEAHQAMRVFDSQKYEYLIKLRKQFDKAGDFNEQTAFLPKYRA